MSQKHLIQLKARLKLVSHSPVQRMLELVKIFPVPSCLGSELCTDDPAYEDMGAMAFVLVEEEVSQ